MIKFNISASSLNLYLENEILFYYSYIAKAPQDTRVPEVYGISGSTMHKALEKYINGDFQNNPQEALIFFKKTWDSKKLSVMPGVYGKFVKYESYAKAVLLGIEKLQKDYLNAKAEEAILFSYFRTSGYTIDLKGFIDVVCKDNKGIYLVDWKSSTSIDSGEAFKRQGLMYFLLYYMKHNVLPYKIVFDYIKIGKTVEYSFTLEEVLAFKQFVLDTTKEIMAKGNDISKYKISDVGGIWNAHKKKCIAEQIKREGGKITCMIENNKIEIMGELPKVLSDMLDLKYSFMVDGCFFSDLYKKKLWDGKTRLFYKRRFLPLAFEKDFVEIVKFYNENTNSNVLLEFVDNRNMDIIRRKIDVTFKKSNVEFRYYQNEAIESALLNKVGILYLGTGAGKTYISSEIVRKLKKQTLFIVNRIELVRQTKKVYEDMLGVEIGEISEGQMDIKEINIASIQSLTAILKRGDETSKKLRKLLYITSLCIFDEAQNVSDSKMYSLIQKSLVNVGWCYGLTGSPWRNDSSTLLMNSLVGFPIYSKTTKELEAEGYLCPTKCYFFHNTILDDMSNDYASQYRGCISENERRNNKVKFLCEKFKHKKILVVTKLVNHAKTLNEEIKNSKLIIGETESKSRKQQFDDFKKDGGTLIGSLKIFSAGIDIPDLDIIINASAHKSSVDSVQLIGRLKRKHKGKEFGYYFDFDDSAGFFKNSAKERKKILKSYGNDIQENVILDKFEL